MTKLLLTACAFGLLLPPAFAQEKSLEQLDKESARIWGVEGLRKDTWTRVVVSGASHRIGFFPNTLHPDCTTQGNIVLRVTKQPEHGKIETVNTTTFPAYKKENIRYKCNQHKVKGVQVNYKSEDKYVGDDAVDLLLISADGYAWELHVDISVR
jgi:hypothetical protein